MTEDAIFATYELVAAAPHEAAEVLAGEGSTGTFVKVAGEGTAHVERFAITIEALELRGEHECDGQIRAELTVRVPDDLAGGDLTTLLASVAGNVTEIAQVSGLRLTALALPDGFMRSCPRPRHGVAGTRALIGAAGRAMTAETPPLAPGLTADEIGESARALLGAGVDLIRDPVLSANPPRCSLEQRVTAVQTVLRKHEQQVGASALYAFTIDDEPAAMVRHAETVQAAGGRCVQLSPTALGVTAIAHLRRSTDLVLHARTSPFAHLSRSGEFGMADAVAQQLGRLAGLDHIPVPSFADAPAAVRSRLEPLLDDADRALPVVAPRVGAGAERDVLLLGRAERA